MDFLRKFFRSKVLFILASISLVLMLQSSVPEGISLFKRRPDAKL